MSMLQSVTRLPNGMIGIAANHFDGLSHQHRVGSVPAMSQGQTGTIWDIDVRASVRSNNARVTAAFCILLEVD